VRGNPSKSRRFQAPALLIIGDSDIVRPEHVVEMFRLLGGGVPGDVNGLPRSQPAVLPGATHVTVVDRTGWLLSLVMAFLDCTSLHSHMKISSLHAGVLLWLGGQSVCRRG